MFAVTPTQARGYAKVCYSLFLLVMRAFMSFKLLLLACILGITGLSAYAAPDIAEPEPTDPAILPAMVPGKMETADSAFAKLDTGKKGYLTTEDTEVMDGFDDAFKAADADRNDQLTPEEFIRGWESYTGIPSSPETFQRTK